jgi:hypothetical protein
MVEEVEEVSTSYAVESAGTLAAAEGHIVWDHR